MKRRDLLWPPLRDLAVWKDLADAIDEVWKDKIDDPQKLFLLLRDIFPFTFTKYGEEPQTGMFDTTDLYPFPKDEYLKNCDLLGFQFSETFFSREDFQLISSTFAAYLPEKVTETCVDYFSYCLSAIFETDTLWAEMDINNKYINFEPELLPDGVTPNPAIGTPVYAGGTWFPTTHVNLRYDFVKFGLFTPYNVRDFFYYIVPLAIVLNTIVFDSPVPLQQYSVAIAGLMTITY